MSTATTTLDPLRFHRMIQTLLPVDMTLLFCLILFFVVSLGYLFYRYRRSQKARTTLVIEIASAKQQLTWKLQNLRLSPGCYKFIVDQQAVSVKMTQLLLSSMLSWGECIVVENKALDLPVLIKSYLNVYPWQSSQLRNILTGDFCLAMYVTDVDSEILDTVVIKALQPLGKDGGQTPDKRQMLYPTLHNYSA